MRSWLIVLNLVVVITVQASWAKGSAPGLASCRVHNQLSEFSNVGSGTLIDRTADNSAGLVLTCWHLFREGTGRIVVQFSDGRKYGARVVALDESADLAALVIANPPVQPVQVAFVLDRQSLTACGYGQSGQYRCVAGSVVRTTQQSGQTSVLISNSVRSGDSGGGVFNRQGQLVAVVWGERNGVTYASCGRPLRNFVGKVLGRRQQQVVVNCPNGLCPRPLVPGLAVPDPAPPITPIPQPLQDTGREEASILKDPRFDRLTAELERLEREKQPSGDYATQEELNRRDASILEKARALVGSGGASVGRGVGKTIATSLGLSGPVGWTVLAAGTVGGWLVGSRMKKRMHGAGGRRRPFLKQ